MNYFFPGMPPAACPITRGSHYRAGLFTLSNTATGAAANSLPTPGTGAGASCSPMSVNLRPAESPRLTAWRGISQPWKGATEQLTVSILQTGGQSPVQQSGDAAAHLEPRKLQSSLHIKPHNTGVMRNEINELMC